MLTKFIGPLDRFQLWKLSSEDVNKILILTVIRYYLKFGFVEIDDQKWFKLKIFIVELG